MSHQPLTRRAVTALLTLAASPALVLVTASPSSATAAATVMVNTQRMTDATLNSTQHGEYARGSRLSLVCHKRGQAVRGYFSPYVGNGGYDNLWYKVSDNHFVADVDIDTGSNNPVVPECSAPAAPPPSSGRAWGRTRSANAAPFGQCTDGAYRQFKAYSGVYPALTGNAKNWYASARATGWSTSLDGEANSIVVFQPRVQGADATYGHVGWVDAVGRRTDGLYVHVVEFNWLGQGARWHTRWVKDVPGMSYILAPRR